MMRGVSFSCSCFVFSSILESTSVTISGEDSLILIKRWRTFSRIGKCRNVFPQCLLPVLLIRHEGPEVSHLCQCPCFDKSSPASVSQLGFPPLFWLCLPQSPFSLLEERSAGTFFDCLWPGFPVMFYSYYQISL